MKAIKRVFIVLLCCAIFGAAVIVGMNIYCVQSQKGRILSFDDACGKGDFDCILVLGCGVRKDGSPTLMLRDRMRRGIELYQGNASEILLLSGDNSRKDYDEVGTMKSLALDAGVQEDSIVLDHAGFSTYESVYRAKEIFKAQKVLIVSQEYHLYRALYIADKLGLDAYGCAANYTKYSGQLKRDIREYAARCKDMVKVIFKPEPTFLGEPLPLKNS